MTSARLGFDPYERTSCMRLRQGRSRLPSELEAARHTRLGGDYEGRNAPTAATGFFHFYAVDLEWLRHAVGGWETWSLNRGLVGRI